MTGRSYDSDKTRKISKDKSRFSVSNAEDRGLRGIPSRSILTLHDLVRREVNKLDTFENLPDSIVKWHTAFQITDIASIGMGTPFVNVFR